MIKSNFCNRSWHLSVPVAPCPFLPFSFIRLLLSQKTLAGDALSWLSILWGRGWSDLACLVIFFSSSFFFTCCLSICLVSLLSPTASASPSLMSQEQWHLSPDAQSTKMKLIPKKKNNGKFPVQLEPETIYVPQGQLCHEPQ